MRAAETLRRRELAAANMGDDQLFSKSVSNDNEVVALSKEELEKAAEKFRGDLKLADDQPLNSLKLQIEDIDVHNVTQIDFLEPVLARKLRTASDEWSHERTSRCDWR